MNKGQDDVEIEKSAADFIAELEQEVATIIFDQERLLRQMCSYIDARKAHADRTAAHLESLKESILHVMTMPLNDLALYYCETKAKNDRRMLKEARKIISLIGLDDPNLNAATRREIELKIGREAEIRDFIKRAEDGVGTLRKICHEAETHCKARKANIEADKAKLCRILAYLDSTGFRQKPKTHR